MSSLVEELKRRNIFRVVTVYGVAGWVMLQLADVTFPALEIPETDIRYILIALIACFPIVIAFAWSFEITPEGLKRTTKVTKEESITSQTGRKINFIIIGLLSVALSFFMWQYFASDSVMPVEASVTTLEDVATTSTPEPEPAEKPSIAVLPLVNMSSDTENEHFSDGLTEELLNVLAQNQSLRVAGRTSSFFYKGKNINLQEIGQALNVDHILEGSVRKSGNQVRVTVQLINSATGFHLWSENYDRELSDIFAIQDDISKRVAEAMDITLLADANLPTSRKTDVVEAHDLYLQAKEKLYERTRESVQQSITLFKEASKLDPNYAPPLLGYAEAVLVAENNHRTMELMEAAELAKPALDRAKFLEFTTSEYWSTLGLYHHHMISIDPKEFFVAQEAYEKAIEMNENNINAYLWYATLLSEDYIQDKEVDSHDRLAMALQLDAKALRLDPKNRVANGNYQINLMAAGQLDQAVSNLERLLIDDPDYEMWEALLGQAYLLQGELIEAANWLAKSKSPDRRTFSAFRILLQLNAYDELPRFFEAVEADNPVYEIAQQMEFSFFGTPSEVITKAKIALLQPDYEEYSSGYVYRLVDVGEYALAQQLIENMHPEYKKENPIFPISSDHASQYIVVTYLKGEKERAAQLAAQRLKQTASLPRFAMRGKGIEDAYYYMVLERPEEAIIELTTAFNEGYRYFFYSQRIDENPIFTSIANDPRIQNIKRQTDQLIAERKEPVLEIFASAGILSDPKPY